MANGFIPDTKRPGHHVTTLQSLPKTIGIEGDRIAVLTCCGASATSPTIRRRYRREVVEACRAEAARLLGK